MDRGDVGDRYLVDFLWGAADRRDRVETDCGGARRRSLGSGARRCLGLGRDRDRRHPDGVGCGPRRGAANGDFRRGYDSTRPRRSASWQRLHALSRTRAADRISRRRCAVPAAADLYQPLVRPTPRHSARPDFVGTIHRRRHLAFGIRARVDLVWLAWVDAGVQPRRPA